MLAISVKAKIRGGEYEVFRNKRGHYETSLIKEGGKMQYLPLNEEQLARLPQDVDSSRPPVRFLIDGRCVNICTMHAHKKGTNIMYHTVYWDRPWAFVKRVVDFLKENNPGCKVTFTYH